MALSRTSTFNGLSVTSLPDLAMFIATLFTIAKKWNQPKCPLIDDWIRKMCCIYTMEYYSAIKKEQNNAIFSNMDGTGDSHPE